jgi:hypothetical protein
MKPLVGIDLNGVVDRVATGDPTSVVGVAAPAVGASIAFAQHRRERPLVVGEVERAREGLGWRGGPGARWWLRDGLDALRGTRMAAPVPDPHGGSHAVGELVGRHLIGLVGGAAERVVVTMPDTWVDVGQQALLDGMGTLRPRTELLWRPVATLLALGERSEHLLDTTREVFVVHVGPDAPEAATYEVTWQTVDGQRFLVPVRNGPGRGLDVQALHAGALARWWQGTAERAGLRVDDVRALEVGWRSAVGESGPTSYARRENGTWVALAAALDARALAAYADALATAIAGMAPASATVLLEGATGNAWVGDRTLFGLVAERLQAAGVGGEIVTAPREAASLGAFAYARRAHHGWPTYLDVLPSLSIQASVDGRPDWVVLVPEGARVAGGTAYESEEVRGFAVTTGTEQLTYYLTRGDEATARSTATQLKAVPTDSVPLALRVRQKPAQGFAEVRIAAADASGWPTVALDWSTMTDTGETPEELVKRLQGEQVYAYPNVEPFPASVEVWRYHDVERILRAFLAVGPSETAFGKRLEQAFSAVGKKGDLKALGSGPFAGATRSHGVIDSDGALPEDDASPTRQAQRTELYRAFLAKIAADFDAVCGARLVDAELRRRLMLLGAWCYVAAPENVAAFARDELRSFVEPRTPSTKERRYAAHLAERSFHTLADMKLLFAVADSQIGKSGRLTTPWIKAAASLFRFREGAPQALDRPRATRLARVAIRTMKDEADARNVQHKFFHAANLLVGLLRVRVVDRSFLTPDDPTTGKLLTEGQSVLIQARRAASGGKKAKILQLVDAIDAYLEGQGTEALIFSKLEAMGGDE